MNQTQTINKLTQPPVFKLAYFTTICERFGFYVLTFLLVLFLQDEYKLTDTNAFLLFSTFTALVFLTPAIGGYLADNYFGIRRCMVLGLFLEGTGLLLLAAPFKPLMPLGLALIIVGVGLFKTAPTDLLAHSYAENDPRIDSGFTLYYMAINIGSLFSSIVAGVMQQYLGWHLTFLCGGLVIYCGIALYFYFRNCAQGLDAKAGEKKLSLTVWGKLFGGTLAATLLFYFLVMHSAIANIFLGIATALTFIYFFYEIFRSPVAEKKKITVCLYLLLVGLACGVLYFQMFTSLELFINRCVDRTIFGYKIPTVIYLSLNPIFVVILGPILSWLYNTLSRHHRDLSVVTKLTIGLFATGLCFFVPVIGGYFANPFFLVSATWIILAFFFFTIGDVMNSALGVAMVTHIAPKRMYGVMMGSWFLVGNALAAALAGVFASFAEVPDTIKDPHIILNTYSVAFTKFGVVSVIVSLVFFLLNPYIKRLAHIE